MADKKISALTPSTTPLTGAEVLPIVQSGSTVKVSVADLTAGRAVAATSITTGLGAVGTPAYTFSGDTNTGIYSPAADTIAFVEGGVESMRIDSSGNIGIGTSSPTNKLQVNGDVAVSYGNSGGNKFWTVFSNDYRNGMLVDGNNRVTQIFATTAAGDAGGVITFSTRQGTASGATDYGTERMRIDSSGNVGIGLTSPGSYGKFASTGTIAAVSPDLSLQGLFSAANDGQIRVGGYKASGTPYLVFTTATDVERMRIDSSGNVGVGTASPNASAILDVQSTTKGFCLPNMTTTQKNAISSPAAGLMVFDTTLAKACVYSGSAWQTITSL